MLRNSHVEEGMDHSDEQVLLAGIREEFNVTFAAAMTDHRKTGNTAAVAILILYLHESPVHLIGFPRSSPVSSSTIALRRNYEPLSWNKILM